MGDILDLSQVQTLLVEQLSRLTGSPSVLVNLTPCVDLNFGDVTSDCLFHLARQVRSTPQALGERLLQALASDEVFRGMVSVSNGFVNIRGPLHTDWLLSAASSGAAPQKSLILLPDRHPKQSFPSYSRLILGAAFQVQELLSFGSSVSVLMRGGQVWITPETAPNFFVSVLERGERESCGFSIEVFPRDLLRTWDGSRILWVSPDTFPAGEFRRFVEDCEVSVVSPSREWCSWDLAPVMRGGLVGEWIREQAHREDLWESLLWLAASDIPGIEVDVSSAGLHEYANVPWFKAETRHRIVRFLGFFETERPLESGALRCTEEERHILVRTKFLPDLRKRAAFLGETQNFVRYEREQLRAFNRYWNAPHRRRALEEGSCDALTWRIISGVYRWLTVRYSQ